MHHCLYPACSRSDAGTQHLIDRVHTFSTFLGTTELLSKVPGSELVIFSDPLQHLKFLPNWWVKMVACCFNVYTPVISKVSAFSSFLIPSFHLLVSFSPSGQPL